MAQHSVPCRAAGLKVGVYAHKGQLLQERTMSQKMQLSPKSHKMQLIASSR